MKMKKILLVEDNAEYYRAAQRFFKSQSVDLTVATDFVQAHNLMTPNLYGVITDCFFPEKTFVLKVRGKGFGRNQIRLMMGTLISLGRSEITLDYIEQSLLSESTEVMANIAPASGLILNKIEFEE